MKKLLFVSPCLSFAGAEKILLWLAKNFSKEKFTVHVVNLNLLNNNSDFTLSSDESEIIIHKLNDSYIKGLNNCFRIAEIVKVIKKEKIDLVIAFTRYPCLISVISGKLAGVPVIISERGDPYQYQYGLKNKIGFNILNKADGCVFQTTYAQGMYAEKLNRKSKIIPNPVFNKNVKWDNFGSKNIISVGRMENKQKRYDIMIKAFEIFSRKYPEYKLLIYGKGPDENQIKNIAKHTSCCDKIKFMGLTNNPTEELIKAKIFLITSDYEGIPNALLEAMAIGMPVISTDCDPGGARLLIENRVNGYLVPKRDVEKISECLCELVENDDLLKMYSTNAYKVIDDFDEKKIFSMWRQYIEEIIRRR